MRDRFIGNPIYGSTFMSIFLSFGSFLNRSLVKSAVYWSEKYQRTGRLPGGVDLSRRLVHKYPRHQRFTPLFPQKRSVPKFNLPP